MDVRAYSSQSRSGSIKGRKLSPEVAIPSAKHQNPAIVSKRLVTAREDVTRLRSFITLPTHQDEPTKHLQKRQKSKSKLAKPRTKRDEPTHSQKNLIGNMMSLQTVDSSKLTNLTVGQKFPIT